MQISSAWLHRKCACVLDILPPDLDANLAVLEEEDENEDTVVIQVKDKWNSQWPGRKG